MKYEELLNFINESTRDELPTQQEVADFLARYYPKEQENKLFDDNWGLYSKHPEYIVMKILLCTTATPEVVDLYRKNNYNLLISHHDNITGVPQIIFHSIMDESAKGHNMYFARRMGLKDVKRGEVTVQGDIYKNLTLDEFKNYLIKHGFSVDGYVYSNPKYINATIKNVIYCSGLGGMLIHPTVLKNMNWENNPSFDIRNNDADVYVTGELCEDPAKTPTNFKYIIELSHTSSEKPLFKWIKNSLLNRWRNLSIDIASKDIDYFGRDKVFGKGEPLE